MDSFKTIQRNSTAQIIDKKSKFISNAYYVENVKEAEEILNNVRKQYNDATHNCYAYNILEEDNIISKSSDDGEPSRNSRSTIIKYNSKK